MQKYLKLNYINKDYFYVSYIFYIIAFNIVYYIVVYVVCPLYTNNDYNSIVIIIRTTIYIILAILEFWSNCK